MRKKRKFRTRPPMQCGICKLIVASQPQQAELIMVNHNPDTGETLPDSAIGCIGIKFPNLAKPILALTD